MQTITNTNASEKIIRSLGYHNPMDAARQQARMILLGRRSRYEAEVRQFERKWGCSLDEMRDQYAMTGSEDSVRDDDYLSWQWYADAQKILDEQLAVLMES